MKTRFRPLLISGLLLAVLQTTYSCKDHETKTIKPVEVSFKKEGEIQIYKAKTDSIIKLLDTEIADTEYERSTGLMYRPKMEENQSMLFIFPDEEPRAFYMKNTQIPLDIIYLNKQMTIVSFQKNAKPMDETSLLSNLPAMYVLEINAGLADKWELKTGDSIGLKQ